MAADVLGQRHDRHVHALFQPGEAERAGPGVVEHGDRALFARDAGEFGNVADFHRQAAGRLDQHCARAIAEQALVCGKIERIVEAGLDAEVGEHARAHGARRIIGIVGDEHDVARPQQGEHDPGDGGDARGIDHRAMGAGLDLGQRFAQRPLRWGAAAAVEEAAVLVAARPLSERCGVLVDMGAGAPDRRVDYRAGPLLASAAAHQFGERGEIVEIVQIAQGTLRS